jgi:hypothetical protein
VKAGPRQDYPIKIYQVNDELNFVVFSMSEAATMQAGAQLLLVDEDTPVATVQLTELDGEGFAVGQIVEMMNGAKPIRKGDLLAARLVMSRVGQ